MNSQNKIADIRKDYKLQSLSEKDAHKNPFHQFDIWWSEVLKSGIEEANAMTLATALADGTPSARVVLLKGYDETGFVFYTNYESEKGRQLEQNPKVCLVLFWKELERQVRISGIVEKVAAAESDAYFKIRPEGSQVGAWASPQSQVIESREWLERNAQRFYEEFQNKLLERPPHWGGYRVKPHSFEFWQGRTNRLHDRLRYTLQHDGAWKIERLAP